MEANERSLEPIQNVPESSPSPSANPAGLRIVILKSDLLYGHLVRQQVLKEWPKARVEVYRLGMEALEAIQQNEPDLFIAGGRIEDMDGLEHLEPFINSSLPILIITSRPLPRFFAQARDIRYDGVYDAIEEGLDNLGAALRRVLLHEPYVSTTFIAQLRRPRRSVTLDELTAMEEVVLSAIGDGSDNLAAGERLALAPETVETHRKRIMKKLHLTHKGEMMVYAVRQGYIVVTANGVQRPGFQRKLVKLSHSDPQKDGRVIRARIARRD